MDAFLLHTKNSQLILHASEMISFSVEMNVNYRCLAVVVFMELLSEIPK